MPFALPALLRPLSLSGRTQARHCHARRACPAAGFQALPYVNPDAPQGGSLRQAVTGTFDSVNPFIIKGTAYGIRTYVFESLLGRNWDEPFSLYGLLAETIDVSDDRQTMTFSSGRKPNSPTASP